MAISKATAVAHPNIAMIKYWGKQDEDLILPVTSSLSVTLDAYSTRTSVEVSNNFSSHSVLLNGEEATGSDLMRVSNFLEIIREKAGSKNFARVSSKNDFPTAAGLASSASGFAALALAAAKAYGLSLTGTELSRLARRGSGSAARSIFGDFVVWNRGVDDATSFAEPVVWNGPEIETIIGVVNSARKSISSRQAMVDTAQTSPYFDAWIQNNEELVEEAKNAVTAGDFKTLGELTELSTMRMHAAMMAASPPIRYLAPKSLELLDTVMKAREDGLSVYATADAGPNIKIFTLAKEADDVFTRLSQSVSGVTFVRSRLGKGARLID